jgi:hypothetical protein
MKKLLLILLCLPLLFSCGGKKETQKKDEYIGKTNDAMKKDIIEVIQQFNIRNNYEVKQQHLNIDPCALLDSINLIAVKINKIALENDYIVILENDVKFQELSNTFKKMLPIIASFANFNMSNTDKEKKAQIDKCKNYKDIEERFEHYFQNKRFEEWFLLQNLVFGLHILDQVNIHIPSENLN